MKANDRSIKRCRCGEVEIPNGWGGVETAAAAGIRCHYFDRCSEPMIVYDEMGGIDPKIWAALTPKTRSAGDGDQT